MDNEQPPALIHNHIHFPPIEQAMREPNGLLAVGGDLSVDRLVRAYQSGIFPWSDSDDLILWWSPDPRAVLYPDKVKISRSLDKTLRNQKYTVTFDQAFADVIQQCSLPRRKQSDTWIHPAMQQAYIAMHKAGFGHSVEVWDKSDKLIGGLYGIAIGRLFFGESMFSHGRDASKIALVYLARQLQQWEYPLIDCQIPNAHLTSMGAEFISRDKFKRYLAFCDQDGQRSPWQLSWSYPA